MVLSEVERGGRGGGGGGGWSLGASPQLGPGPSINVPGNQSYNTDHIRFQEERRPGCSGRNQQLLLMKWSISEELII